MDDLLEKIEKKRKLDSYYNLDMCKINVALIIQCYFSFYGAMYIHRFIGKFPRPKKGYVWPGHRYTGPNNPLEKQLDEDDLPIIGQELERKH